MDDICDLQLGAPSCLLVLWCAWQLLEEGADVIYFMKQIATRLDLPASCFP
jgi:hypothetical protein